MERLEAEADRGSHFQRLRLFLTGEPAKTSYRQLAEEMGVSEGAAKMAVHRLRGKLRTLLQAQVAETVAGLEEVKEELRYLLSVLAALTTCRPSGRHQHLGNPDPPADFQSRRTEPALVWVWRRHGAGYDSGQPADLFDGNYSNRSLGSYRAGGYARGKTTTAEPRQHR